MASSNPLLDVIDADRPVTEREFQLGLYASIGIGLFYTANAFLPVLTWYMSKKTDI